MGKDKKAPTFELKKRYDAVYSGNALEVTNRYTKTLSIDYDGNIVSNRINSKKIVSDFAYFEQGKHSSNPAVIEIRDIKSSISSLLINSLPGSTVQKALNIHHSNIEKVNIGYDGSINCVSLTTTNPLEINQIEN